MRQHDHQHVDRQPRNRKARLYRDRKAETVESDVDDEISESQEEGCDGERVNSGRDSRRWTAHHDAIVRRDGAPRRGAGHDRSATRATHGNNGCMSDIGKGSGQGVADGAVARVDRWSEKTSTPILTAAFLSLFLVCLIDYYSGPNLAFSVFYIPPIAVVAWVCSRIPALIAASVGAIAWGAADVLAGADYSTPLIPVWNTFSRFAVFGAFALLIGALRGLRDHEQRLARTDPTTGCANTLAFQERATVELARLARYGTPLTLAYLDLDDFKKVNDESGHQAGDDLLHSVGKALTTSTRIVDVVARLGGDEFAVLLPHTDKEGAAAVLRHIQERVPEATKGVGSSVTFSLGAVTFLTAPGGVDEMVAAADKLMYQGKSAGKGACVHEVYVDLADPRFERG